MKEKDSKIVESNLEQEQARKTWSGITLKELYTPEDVRNIDYDKDIAASGEYPFTRGIYRDMYRGRLWTSREITGLGTPTQTNERLKFELESGARGLDVISDMPGQMGIDPDHPRAKGEVGRLGASLTTLLEMEQMLDGIPCDQITFVFDNSPAHIASTTLAQYLVANEKRGVSKDKLNFTIQNDPWHIFLCGGGAAGEERPLDLALKVRTDVLEYGVREGIQLYNQVNLYDMRELGVTAPQEIAFAFSIAIAYMDEALKRGLTIDEIVSRTAFVCSCHIDFFEEIAKFRAARRMWARLIRERYKSENKRSWRFRFGVHTAGCSLYPQQIPNNIVRVAYQVLAAALGGAQAIVPCCFDEPVSTPTAESHRLALRTQQIVAHELAITNVTDPLGGSYYVESLTNKVEEEANAVLRKIEELGGAGEALRTRWFDKQGEKSSIQHIKEIETGERIIIGVNAFTMHEEKTAGSFHRYDPEAERVVVAQLKELKQRRDNDKVRKALEKIQAQAEQSKRGDNINLIPAIIEAVRVYATLGEICGIMRQGYGYTYDVFDGIRAVL